MCLVQASLMTARGQDERMQLLSRASEPAARAAESSWTTAWEQQLDVSALLLLCFLAISCERFEPARIICCS